MLADASLILAVIFVPALSSLACSISSEDAATISSARAPIFHEANHEQAGPQQHAKKQGKDNYGSLRENERLLMKELKAIQKSDSYKKGVFKVELIDDNLYEWRVNMTFPDPDSALHKDLEKLKNEGKGEHVVFKMSFTENYPGEPPFVRIIYPQLVGGQVKTGGVLCMQLLSQNGWSSGYSMEGFFLSIALHLTEHNLIRIEFNPGRFSSFTDEEARDIFESIVKAHEAYNGWSE